MPEVFSFLPAQKSFLFYLRNGAGCAERQGIMEEDEPNLLCSIYIPEWGEMFSSSKEWHQENGEYPKFKEYFA